MSKPLETHAFLMERAQKIVSRIAPDMPIKIAITYQDDQVQWDKDCTFGRVHWDCKVIIPLGHPARAFLPKLNRGMAYLQSRYDLGVLAPQVEQRIQSRPQATTPAWRDPLGLAFD
jgi:hypothetical protein